MRVLALAVATLALGAPAAAAAIRAPRGVHVTTYARGLGSPTNVAFDPRGGMWTTSAAGGGAADDGVWYVRRRGAAPVHVVSDLLHALGLAWYRDELYVSSVAPDRLGEAHTGRVLAFSGFDGRRFRRRRTVLRGLPIGEHEVDTIVPGRGARLYVGIGSTGDTSVTGRLSGTVVSFAPHGGHARVEARGLRNPYGLDFIPGTGELLVSDNGSDRLGPTRPPDELNVFDPGGPALSFGFPACHEQGGPACRGSQRPVARLPAHAAAGGVAVARRWGHDRLSAFVAEFGSSFPGSSCGASTAAGEPTAAGSRTASPAAARSGWRSARGARST
jgi:glucose/arabinose dehydrogenase